MMAMSQRITVGVTTKTREILDVLSEVEELSVTDIVNRAIQLYDFVLTERSKGNRLAIKTDDGETFLVHLA